MTSIGVVVVSFDHARYVEGCLTSVFDQTRPPDRVLVVDDGSIDGTVERVESFGRGVELIRTARVGPSEAFNRGVDAIATDVVAAIAADDEFLPGRLEAQLDALDRLDVDLVLGLPEVIDDEGNPRSDGYAPEFFPPASTLEGSLLRTLFRKANFLCAGTASFRRMAFLSMGGYQPGLLQLQDFHLWVRWSWRRMAVLDDRVIRYRKAQGGLSAVVNDRRMLAELVWVYRHFFDGMPDSVIRSNFPEVDGGDAWDRELALARLYLGHGSHLIRQVGAEILVDVAGAAGGVERLGRAGYTLQDLFAVTAASDVAGDAGRRTILDDLMAVRGA